MRIRIQGSIFCCVKAESVHVISQTFLQIKIIKNCHAKKLMFLHFKKSKKMFDGSRESENADPDPKPCTKDGL